MDKENPEMQDAEQDEKNTEQTEYVSGQENEKNKKRSPLSYIVEFGIYLVMILLCIFWVPEHVIQRTVVDGSSMRETLHDGESLLVEKVSYHFSDPDRYDIVVFYPYGKSGDKEKDEYYVKRIYGLPGETVQIKGNEIYINGEVIADDYAKDGTIDEAGIAEEPVTLSEDEYFVLGDNRGGSKDSRDPEVGLVKRKNIAGRVIFRIWPLKKFGVP